MDIFVYADWKDLAGPLLMGVLSVTQVRGKEVFSFAYDKGWLGNAGAFALDPDLQLFTGPQFLYGDKPNFGLFTDSVPDRWGRLLMKRREALLAKQEERKLRTLQEIDFLLGVYDGYRMGALRFKRDPKGPFLDDRLTMSAPPMTTVRTLEEASLHLEDDNAADDPAYSTWLKELISPGASLGGARPKASVTDPAGRLWIAKFPSKNDDHDLGGWEGVANILAIRAGLRVAEGKAQKLTQRHHTFLTRRFDRDGPDRLHFASAMTLLGRTDGADAAAGSSYLELAELLMRQGAQPNLDMEELWRRIVFNISIQNSDDHLRNHGFLLTSKGWVLSPAYDLNPVPDATGLTLNISEDSNALDLDLARSVAGKFRISPARREEIIGEINKAVGHWREVARHIGIPRGGIALMENAFIET